MESDQRLGEHEQDARAEGVEDEGIVDALRQIGCDVAQGYFASRPLPADALATWLQTSPWGEARVQSRQFATLQP